MYTYQKKPKKIFPLRVSDAFYSGLKYAAHSEGVPVSAFVRKHLKPIIEQTYKISQKKSKRKLSLAEFAKIHTFTGKTYFEDKSVDEILYGGKLHNDEK